MENASALRNDNIPYVKLQQHLDSQPVGFPPSRNGADIRLLKHIFTPKEAEVATCLNHLGQPLDIIFKRAAHIVTSKRELEKHLTSILKKGGLEFRLEKGQRLYANTPLVVGMYELQLERLSPEFIQDFKAYTSEKRYGISFLATKLPQMRTIPIGKSITPKLPVADFDQINKLLETASDPFVILPCICRRKKSLQEEPCQQTDRTETCMAMGGVAQTLLEMEIGREISRNDAMDIIRENQKEGLVLQPGNTQDIEFLCSCCGCCCSMLSLQKELPRPLDFWASNFQASIDPDCCISCGKCIIHCQTQALTPAKLSKKKSKEDRPKPNLNLHRCIGCGNCVPACPTGALSLIPCVSQVRPPKNREGLNTILLREKKNKLAPIKVIGKLAKGIALTGDLNLLKKKG